MANANRWAKVFQCIATNQHDVNALCEIYGDALLHIAARQGNVTAGKRLLQLNANPRLQSRSGFTAMLAAITRGHVDFCAALPPCCLTDRTGCYSILTWACITWRCRSGCSPEATQWLLRQPGIDPDAQSWERVCDADRVTAEEKACVYAAFAEARAWRRRWTTTRAAWMAACCV